MKITNESPILIEEDMKAIKNLYQEAEARAIHLNNFCKVSPVHSSADYQNIVDDVDHWIRRTMLQDPEIRNLSKLVAIESMLIPDQLQAVKRFVNHFPDGNLLTRDLVCGDGGKWNVDKSALRAKENLFRRYASTKIQKARYHAAKELADFLNKQKIGVFSRQNFDSIMVDFKLSDSNYHPRVTFILAAEDAFTN